MNAATRDREYRALHAELHAPRPTGGRRTFPYHFQFWDSINQESLSFTFLASSLKVALLKCQNARGRGDGAAHRKLTLHPRAIELDLGLVGSRRLWESSLS